MSELSKALKKVLANVNALSDEALQAEFDACRNGPVGRAILEGQRLDELFWKASVLFIAKPLKKPI